MMRTANLKTGPILRKSEVLKFKTLFSLMIKSSKMIKVTLFRFVEIR